MKSKSSSFCGLRLLLLGRDQPGIVQFEVPGKEHNDTEDDKEQQRACEEGKSFHLKQNVDDSIGQRDKAGKKICPLVLDDTGKVNAKRCCCHHGCNQVREPEGKEIGESKQELIEEHQRSTDYQILYDVNGLLGDNLNNEACDEYQEDNEESVFGCPLRLSILGNRLDQTHTK